ncbi:tetratricopeptide repeat protein [Haliovirga abyssi]|uniref:Tetratricopeptide repeat protein n=1 Tax=Haliovirga abyssi TaxID=2996794 RepID=A0AAU9DZU4_9FUSO|nr:tetratricopeptide repeat protein [Haliovirga abyssi]BDU51110.1 hypothetical protein HLVA_16790 [Haliovirga abyssi]
MKLLNRLLIAILIMLTIVTLFRNMTWLTGVTLNMDIAKKTPKKARGWINLGVNYYKEKDYDNAIKYLEKAIKIDPRYPHTYVTIGRIYVKQKKYKIAFDYYKKAVKEDDSFSPAYEALADLFKELKNREKETFFLEQIMDKGKNEDKNNFKVLLRLGKNYIELKNPEKALKYNLKAYELNQNDYNVLTNLGVAYSLNKEYEKAEPLLKRGIDIKPNDGKAYNNLGILYYRIGEKEKAIKILTKGYEMSKSKTVLRSLNIIKDRIKKGENK